MGSTCELLQVTADRTRLPGIKVYLALLLALPVSQHITLRSRVCLLKD